MPSHSEFPREPTYSYMHLAALFVTTEFGDFVTRPDPLPPVFNFPYEPGRYVYLVSHLTKRQELGEFVKGVYNGMPLRSWNVYALRPSVQDAEAYDQEHGRTWIKEGRLVP